MAGVITAADPSWTAPFTGLSPRALSKLVTQLRREGADAPGRGRPWRLPLADRVLLVAAYWRTNLTLRQLAPLFGVSKSAASRVIDHPAGLLVLDEPTAALDPRVEHRVFTGLRRLAADRAVVLVTHRLTNTRSPGVQPVAVARRSGLMQLSADVPELIHRDRCGAIARSGEGSRSGLVGRYLPTRPVLLSLVRGSPPRARRLGGIRCSRLGIGWDRP